MDWRRTLFSFYGRIGRRTFWLASMAATLGSALLAVFCFALFYFDPLGVAGIDAAVLSLPLLFWIWSALALAAKRLHDRGRTAWWLALPFPVSFMLGVLLGSATPEPGGAFSLLLGFVVIGWLLWMAIEIGFLRGTAGPNRFGEDPLDLAKTDAEM